MKRARRTLGRVAIVAFGFGALALLIWALAGPRAFDVVWKKLRPATPHQRYARSLSHEARESGVYVLRIQPELLRGGHMKVTSQPTPSLHFPVAGAGAHNIQSLYGVARDGGRRRHEGVDIFASRGTPVLAGSD